MNKVVSGQALCATSANVTIAALGLPICNSFLDICGCPDFSTIPIPNLSSLFYDAAVSVPVLLCVAEVPEGCQALPDSHSPEGLRHDIAQIS